MAFVTVIGVLTIFPFLEIGGLIDNDVVWMNIMFAMVYLLMNTCWLCDAMTCLFDVNKYGDVDFMSILMSDDDVLLCGLYHWVTYIA